MADEISALVAIIPASLFVMAQAAIKVGIRNDAGLSWDLLVCYMLKPPGLCRKLQIKINRMDNLKIEGCRFDINI
ncbi:hypothetical protein [Paraburkholderia hayleyella]|uniref:hypothetical protein n=1 Tax=Paraburkholderia hayleyella TaxID=2152889 RepID=UPI001291EF9F|nr:hypothetical protein [Paraburkholderia hayleyella]